MTMESNHFAPFFSVQSFSLSVQVSKLLIVFLERELYFCPLSQSSTPARIPKLLQSEDGAGSLARELTASLKLLAGVAVFAGDATGDLLLDGCE